MFGFYVIKSYAMQKLHMSSKQTCICLAHAVCTKCDNGCVFVKTKSQSTVTTALQQS